MKFFLVLLATFLASALAKDFNLENALNQLNIFPGKKLTYHFERLQSKAMPITDDCYNSTLNMHGDQTNVFEEDVRDVVQKFFKAFPQSLKGLSGKKYVNRVSIFIESLAEYVEKIYQCESDKLKSGSRQQQLCLTSVSSLSSAERSALRSLPFDLNEQNQALGQSQYKTCDRNHIPGEKLAPAAYNWNTTGFVSPVKAQGTCGTCFIFSTIAAAESAYYRFKGTPHSNVTFSEQAVLNCLYENLQGTEEDPCVVRKDGHTAGGPVSKAYLHIRNYGLVLGEDEPYVSKTGHCKAYNVATKILDFCNLKQTTTDKRTKMDDEILKRLLFRNGPLTISMDSNNLQFKCPDQPFTGPCHKHSDHGVLLVAYDEQFWYFKNSWGTGWGEHGFFKMSRDSKICDDCTIYDHIFVPFFKSD